MLSIETRSEFEKFLEEHDYPRFTHPSLEGVEEDLVPGGGATHLSFDNRREYVSALTRFRLEELRGSAQAEQVRLGLATMVPAQALFGLLSAADLEESVCGGGVAASPRLEVLRANTTYQAGLTERDGHIAHFWAALESLSPVQLRGFVKFACNQERLPSFGADEAPPPPFPMKLAPADRSPTEPDAVNIRAETCMFMVKLPVYSSFTVMRQKILFAINAAYDPLSG